MTTSERFDELAKSLGSGLPRRIALKKAAKSLVLLVGTPLGVLRLTGRESFGDDIPTTQLRERLNDPAWICRSTSAVRIDVDSEGAKAIYHPICVHNVKCESRGMAEPYVLACQSLGDKCRSLKECASIVDKDVVYTSGRLTPKAEKSANFGQYGSQCRYLHSEPTVVYRKQAEKDVWDAVCASPVQGCTFPPKLKGSFLATCKPDGEAKIEGKTYVLCPAAHDCLAKPLPVVMNPPMAS